MRIHAKGQRVFGRGDEVMREESARRIPRTVLAAGAVLCLTFGCGSGEDHRAEAPAGDAPAAACEGLPGPIERIECHVDRATRAGHPKACQEAAENGVRYQCLAILAGRLQDASLCDDIPPSSDETRALRDACLSDVAAVLEESALCERVLLAGVRDSCYLEIARTTDDASLCDRIGDPGLNSLCTGDPVVVD
jgi:hypothetical protein